MTTPEERDAARWHDLQKQAVKLMITGTPHQAIRLIDAFVADSPAPTILAAALGFRADLKAEAG